MLNQITSLWEGHKIWKIQGKKSSAFLTPLALNWKIKKKPFWPSQNIWTFLSLNLPTVSVMIDSLQALCRSAKPPVKYISPLSGTKAIPTYLGVCIEVYWCGREIRYPLMKCHISSWLFTKIDNFFPFFLEVRSF